MMNYQQERRTGMGKRKFIEGYNDDDIDHIFQNQDRKIVRDLKPFYHVEYHSKHKYQKNIAKEKMNSYNMCPSLDKAKERNREIDKEEIRQIMKENKKLKKFERIQKQNAIMNEMKINQLRFKHPFVIV